MFDECGQISNLEDARPGPELAARLASIDRDTVTDYELVTLLQARSRQVAHLQAELYADMVAVAQAQQETKGAEVVFEFAADEIRAALSWTRRAAESHLNLAHQLVESFPQVWNALSEALIDLPKAKVIVYGLTGVDPEIATRVADLVLERAQFQTTGQIAARLRRLIMRADPNAAAEQYRIRLSDRRVVVEPNPDGTASIYGLNLPAERALAALDRINHLADYARGIDDLRTIDQIRADVLLDLLEGRSHSTGNGHRPVIDLKVDLTTLAGLDENPGEIPGWGPVIADVVHQIVKEQPGAEWRVTVTDPDTGQAVWNGLTRRRPNSAQKRHVQSRNPSCVFPGCRMPAIRSDLDHRNAWKDGGPTDASNINPLCRHDHRAKHEGGWQLEGIRPGVYKWTSPLGHEYKVVSEPP